MNQLESLLKAKYWLSLLLYKSFRALEWMERFPQIDPKSEKKIAQNCQNIFFNAFEETFKGVKKKMIQ